MTGNYGFVKVAAAIPTLRVGDCAFNTSEIARMVAKAADDGVQMVCFPELSVTGYTCGDLFHQQLLIEQAEEAVSHLLEETLSLATLYILGAPVRSCGKLFNCAVICHKGRVTGIVPKTFLPNYNEFYEKRWFVSANEAFRSDVTYCGTRVPFGAELLFQCNGFAFGVEICEDLWAPVPPSSHMALVGAHILFNLSASNELVGKHDYRKALVAQQSARCMAGYVYASSGWGESTTDIVFSGNGIICENGVLLAESRRFQLKDQLVAGEIDIDRLRADRQKINSFIPSRQYQVVEFEYPETGDIQLSRKVNPKPFVPSDTQYNEHCEDIFSIQVGGLAKRLSHTKSKSSVVGVSGGLDSTLALLVCAKTYDKLGWPRHEITGITMPGFGTTSRTRNNALSLMQSLGVTIREIDITAACNQHFADVGHDPAVHDVTYENVQARERTQILMDIANQTGGLVIGTGDMSELALGWATYNGDHMSMYGVNSSIPKTLVRSLVSWIAATQVDEQSGATLTNIIETPVSPELLPATVDGEIAQRTEEIIGPYELHDFFLYYMLRFGFAPGKIFFLAQHAFAGIYTDEVVRRWMKVFYRRFFAQQFKRSCMPDGPKVGSINLSPRGDWRMPSDACADLWLKAVDEMY
ncbi:MAG: NAD(+) synthase [Bacteroidales bacterium]|jgi:NAD+ synthase (glutamine-hydrolysing)|nr:NAD(+) synthase [Bacteroidales bacterium]